LATSQKTPSAAEEREFAHLRTLMVDRHVAARGIQDERILKAMREVPRHRFVPAVVAVKAYGPGALPIGKGQTISQPYIVARMIELLDLSGNEKVLEIGTGSGYQAAILAECARSVVTVERWPMLAGRAARLLGTLGYTNIEVHIGDGTLGWQPAAPYDAILVTAAAPVVPEPLLQQLRLHGRLDVPVGSPEQQELLRLIGTLVEEHPAHA